MSDYLDTIQALARARLAEVMSQREEILAAFIAKYGFEPERAVQIEQRQADGTSRWFVQRRTDEDMLLLSQRGAQL